MEFSWTIFAIGVALGIVQLVVGIALGRSLWPRRREADRPPAPPQSTDPSEPEPLDPRQLRGMATRLQRLVTNVANDVGHHQVRIEQITKDLSALRHQQRAGTTDFLLGRVSEIVEVNRQLQVRLAKVEGKLQQQAEEIKLHVSQAQTDALTGLPNRREFEREIHERLNRWTQRGIGFCLVMIDADDLKPLNDRYGHLAGDALLRAMAETLDGELTPRDVAARIGGDEFALILAEDDLAKATARCERIRRAVAGTKVDLGAGQTCVSASMGLAQISPGEGQAELMSRADAAMYVAKAAGKARAYFHDGALCLPIQISEAESEEAMDRPAATPQPPAQDVRADGDPDVAGLCDDVRQRLDEVLDAGREPSDRLHAPSA
ncbi:MAG: GGDEF domain-containing protein [Pirellulales bacterium]|nr:GGDEF domain-containing protein [Pirellulales bacterium]